MSSGRRWSGVSTLRAKYVAVTSDPLTAAPTTAALLAPVIQSTFCAVRASTRVGATPAIVSGEPSRPRPPSHPTPRPPSPPDSPTVAERPTSAGIGGL